MSIHGAMSDNEDSFELAPLPLAKLREWLQPTDYDGDGSEYRKHISSYTSGTDEWIFDTPEWGTWHTKSDRGFLRLVGIPGSGKSVQAAHLVHRLTAENVPVLFFFFRQIIDANHTPQALLRDWLAQLLPFSLPLQLEIGNLTTARRDLASVSMEDLWKLLRLGLQDQPRIYAIADALDEMDAGNDDFLRALAALGQWRPSMVKVLATSRPDPSMERILRHPDMGTMQIRLEQKLVDLDIVKYVSHRLTGTAINAEDQTRIREAVPGRASGLFLYARLAMDRFVEPNADIADALTHLPLDLDCMYANLLHEHARRSGTTIETQLQLLRWVTHASRPLRLLELADIINFTREPSQRDLKLSKALVRTICGPLIEVLPNETLSVCHHTLTEFLKGRNRSEKDLESYPILNPIPTHVSLATDCLQYLSGGCLVSHAESKGGTSSASRQKRKAPRTIFDFDSEEDDRIAFEQNSSKRAIQMNHPFALYAAQNWHVHVVKAIDHGASDETMTTLNFHINQVLEPQQERCVLVDLANLVGRFNRKSASGGGLGRLHIAAWAGLDAYVSELLNEGVDVNEVDDNDETPLHWAAQYGRDKVVTLLIAHGADPDPANEHGLKPLHLAAQRNHARIVTLLLRADVSPNTTKTKEYPGRMCGNAPSTVGETPLKYASQVGAVDAVNAFWPYLQSEQKLQSLHWAIPADRSDLIDGIIRRSDIDLDAKLYGNTALHLACQTRSASAIKMLVQAGADPNSVCLSDLTPTYAFACSNDNYSNVPKTDLDSALETLIEAGGDVKRIDSLGKTMLHHLCADSYDYTKTTSKPPLIKRLLDAGLDANAVDRFGQTALHVCLNDEGGDIRQVLIRYGHADINKTDAEGTPPLMSMLAKSHWYYDLSNLLDFLSLKPNCAVVDNHGNTPLHVVLRSLQSASVPHAESHLTIIDALLGAGADPKAQNSQGETPLHLMTLPTDAAASESALRQIIETLLWRGTRLEARDHLGQTVLFRFISQTLPGCKTIFSIFLSLGAELYTRDLAGRTLLHEAIKRGVDNEFFQWLVSQGLDIRAVDAHGNTLVHEAVLSNQLGRLDRSHPIFGLSLEQRNLANRTPLMIASRTYSEGYGTPSALEVLLPKCEGVSLSDSQGITALHAASCVSESYVAQLLNAGADIAAVTADRLTALHLAARSRQDNTVGLLCDRISASGLDLINAKDADGRTALHHACRSGRVESVVALLRSGASVNVQDESGLTPLSACAEHEQGPTPWSGDDPSDSCIRDLSSRASNRSYAAHSKVHGLVHPARTSHNYWDITEDKNIGIDEIIDLLLTHGADVALKVDKVGHTVLSDAMSFALRQGYDYTYGCFLRLRDRLGLAKEVMSYPSMDSLLMEHRITSALSALREWSECSTQQFNQHMLGHLLVERRYDLVREIIRTCRTKSVLDMCKRKFARWGFAQLLDLAFQREREMTEADIAPSEDEGKRVTYETKPLILLACERVSSNIEVLKVIAKQPDCRLDERDSRKVFSIGLGDYAYGGSALHALSTGEHWWQVAEGLPFLLEAGADAEARDENGQTPLQVSLRDRFGRGRYRKQVARVLMEHGADVDAVTSLGQSCLAMTSDLELVRLLLKHGAELSVSALFAAVEERSPELLQELLQLGIDPNARLPAREDGAGSVETLEWLPGQRAAGHSPKPIPSSELYVLHYAVKARVWRVPGTSPPDHNIDLALIRILLEHGADPYRTFVGPMPRVNGRSNEVEANEEQSIVHQAFAHKCFLEPFLQLSDLNMQVRDVRGRTLFLVACSRGRNLDANTITGLPPGISLIQHLLSRGADVSARDVKGDNALHICLTSSRPDHEVDTIMAKAPHLVSLANNRGDTPFHLAVRFGHKAFIDRMLPLRGANTSMADSAGNTPLHYLASQTAPAQLFPPFDETPEAIHQQAESYLEEKFASFRRFIALGVSINAENNEGATPLATFVARAVQTVAHSSFERVKLELETFMSVGADIQCRNARQQNLLHVVVAKPAPVKYAGVLDDDSAEQITEIYEFLVGQGLDPWAEDEKHMTSIDMATVNGHARVVKLFENGKRNGAALGKTEG